MTVITLKMPSSIYDHSNKTSPNLITLNNSNLGMNNTPLYEYTKIYLSICPLMDIWVVFNFLLLWILL